MKSIKYTLLALVASSAIAQAQYPQIILGGGYGQITQEFDFVDDVDVDMLYLSIGTEIATSVSPNLVFVPEFRIGKSFSDNDVSLYGSTVEIDVNYAVSLSLKAQYNINEFYVHTGVTYTRIDVDASISGTPYDFSDSDSDFGYVVGAGYNFSNNMAVEINADFYDGDTSAISAALKWKF